MASGYFELEMRELDKSAIQLDWAMCNRQLLTGIGQTTDRK